MVQSSHSQTQFIKYCLMTVGMIFCIIGLYSLLAPVDLKIDEYSYQKSNFLDSIIYIAIGLILILTNQLYLNHVRIVSLNLERLELLDSDGTKEILHWDKVESLHRIRFIAPPVYRIKIKNTGESFVFTTEHSQGKYLQLHVPFINMIFDYSAMSKEIKKVKTAYQI